MRKPRRKIVKGYVVVHPRVGPLLFSLRSTRKASVEDVTHNYVCSWRELKSDGYVVKKAELNIK